MGADGGYAGLGPVLWRLLAWSLLGAVAVAAFAGLAVATLGVGSPARAARFRRIWFGEPAADREPSARRFLRCAFGALWIVDGMLQAQPRMPAGFIGEIQAQADTGPGWLAALVDPLARAWLRHPVAADAATVWVQVGIGLLLLLGGRGLAARLAAWAALGWGLVVWVLGEALGGLLQPGATWWTGAPGAVLVYVLAAVVLLLPWAAWQSGRAQVVVRRAVAGWLAAAAVLQALPWEGGWTARGAAAPFAAGAALPQPALLSRPLAGLALLAGDHPAAVNATTIALVAAAAVALWVSGRTAVLASVLVLCAATWWFAQDFGVLGGLASDPNTALPLAVLLASALPAWPRPAERAAAARPEHRTRVGLVAGAVALALLGVLVVPASLAAVVPGPPDATALAANSQGGVQAIPHRPVPRFTLVDQRGRQYSTADLHGRLLLVTFLDPVCSSDCPLIANQLASADRRLGGLRDRVDIVAIDTNPVFNQIADVDAFTRSHGLGDLPNWHFVCGPTDTVQELLGRFGIAVDVPTVGMIEHSEGIYFVTPDGRESSYLFDGAAENLTTAYAQRIGDEIRSLL